MADKEDFLTLQQEIASVPAKQAVEPPMPPEQLVDEAEMAADLASRHAEALAPLGITADVIDKLAKAAGAMRYAQAEWSNQVFDSTEAQQQWREDSPLGYELRDDVLAALEFGAGGDAGLLRKISNIRKGQLANFQLGLLC